MSGKTPAGKNPAPHRPDPVRDAEAARLRALRFTGDQIAEQMGYADASGALRAAKRGRDAAVREPHQDMLLMDLSELDEMAREAWKVLRGTHYKVADGRVVRLDEEPLVDEAPVLQAISKLLDIQARRAKLVGLDAPTRTRVEVFTEDSVDAEIERLSRELADQD